MSKIKFPIALMLISSVIFALSTCALLDRLNNDIDGAEDAANRYCEMVYNGHWPDYQQNYNQFCDKDKWNGK